MHTSEIQPQYVRTSGASAFTGVPVSSLEKRRLNGDGPAFYKIGRNVFYKLADLELWMASRRRSSTSDQGVKS